MTAADYREYARRAMVRAHECASEGLRATAEHNLQQALSLMDRAIERARHEGCRECASETAYTAYLQGERESR